MKVISHSELVKIGYKWCLGRCGFVFKELATISSETPDVIGFNSSGTFVLEAKTSKSDFLADKKKWFRKQPEKGMGDWRFYICTKGLIKVSELPKGWGLIEVSEKGKARTTFNPFGKGNIYYKWEKNQKSHKAEQQVMYSALRRLQVRGLVDEIYKTVRKLKP